LKEEIQKDGLLSPLIVREVDGNYELVDGERRLRALRELGWKEIPVEVRNVDDRIARLSVYKLNMIRMEYSVEERARYFKKLNDGGMTFYQIAKDLSLDDQWVLAHINVFRLPEDMQKAVWEGQLSLTHIRELESMIGANVEDAVTVAKEIMLRRLTQDETRKLIQPRLEAIEMARIEAAKKAIGAAAPMSSIKLETPEDFEKASLAMRREAERRRIQERTPEEKADIEAESRRKQETRLREVQEQKRREEAERKRREEEDKRRIEEEANRRAKVIAESQRRRIEEEARTGVSKQVEIERSQLEKEIRNETREELMHDQEFRRQVAETIPRREPKEELAVREGTVYTIGELDCDRCKKHYVIKCDGKRNWLE
jgi:ParB/RepB/Spo0J family partition protein